MDSLRPLSKFDDTLRTQIEIFDQWNDDRVVSIEESETELQRALRILKAKANNNPHLQTILTSIVEHVALLPDSSASSASLMYWEMVDRFITHAAACSETQSKEKFAKVCIYFCCRQRRCQWPWQ